jgi:hypothetical protein
MTQSVSSHYDPNKAFYQMNSASMATMSNISYDPNQFIHAQTSNNQSQPVIFENASPKKIRFAPSHHQQGTSVKKPLTGTQSWHELSITTNDTPTTRPISTMHGSITTMANTKPSAPKPIYVDIDHRATLAERGQTTATNSDGLNFNPNKVRKRPNVRHQYKHQELFDSSPSKAHIIPSKSVDSLQTKVPSSQRSRSANRLVQNSDQMPLVNNEIIPSKNRENHRHHRRRQQVLIMPHNSPLRSQSLPRGIESRQHSNTPVMRIRTSQQQPVIQSENVTRTRI